MPYQVFATADGFIVLSVGNDQTFTRFCTNFGLDALPADPRFATNAARVANRELVVAALTPVIKAHPTNWWISQLEALKIGCGPINTLKDVFADPQIVARQAVVEMQHNSGVPVKVFANPVRLSETPVSYRIAPPSLGLHTEEILRRWSGLDDEALARLREKNII